MLPVQDETTSSSIYYHYWSVFWQGKWLGEDFITQYEVKTAKKKKKKKQTIVSMALKVGWFKRKKECDRKKNSVYQYSLRYRKGRRQRWTESRMVWQKKRQIRTQKRLIFLIRLRLPSTNFSWFFKNNCVIHSYQASTLSCSHINSSSIMSFTHIKYQRSPAPT